MHYRSCWSCLDLVSHAQNNLKKSSEGKIYWRCASALSGSIHLWPLFTDSLCHEDKTSCTVAWERELLFTILFLTHLCLFCRDPLQLHSVTLPRPEWMLHIVFSGIILYGPLNNSPLTPSEETFCSQSTNARCLFIGLLFLGGRDDKRAYDQKVNSGATFQ